MRAKDRLTHEGISLCRPRLDEIESLHKEELGAQETRLQSGMLTSRAFTKVALHTQASVSKLSGPQTKYKRKEKKRQTYVSDNHPRLAASLELLGRGRNGVFTAIQEVHSRVDTTGLVVHGTNVGVLGNVAQMTCTVRGSARFRA